MTWEEWAVLFRPLGGELFWLPVEPPAILSMSAILEFLSRALVPALGSRIQGATFFMIFSDTTITLASSSAFMV